jgi:hypothetical protein
VTRGLRVHRSAGKLAGMRFRMAASGLAAAVALLGPLAAFTLASPETAAPNGRVVQYAQDALTVRLDKVPLAEVLADIGQQSGAEIRGTLREPREVTAEFESVPLSEALGRLLGDQNFALVYDKAGGLRAVKLLGGPLAGGVPIPGQAAPAVAPVAKTPTDLRDILANHPPVPVHGRLAQALGTDSATLQQLMELGLHNEDPTVRAEALRAGVQTLEGDPTLRQAVIGALNSFDDAALGTLLRGAAGENAEEVAMQVLTQSRAPEVRVKASSVLQKLRHSD